MGLMSDLDYKTIVLATAISASGATALNQVAFDPRPDPFTGKQAAELEKRLAFEHEVLEARIRRDMPPIRTRDRIEALEDSARRVDPAYKAPSRRFSGP